MSRKSRFNRRNLLQHFQMELSQKRKIFSQFLFFLHFVSLDSILNIFRKKMSFLADILLNLRTPKYVIREVSKNSRLTGPFNK